MKISSFVFIIFPSPVRDLVDDQKKHKANLVFTFFVIFCYNESDPIAVVYTKGRDGALQELGRTEVVLNSLNPKWIRKHTVTYHFEVVQTLVCLSWMGSNFLVRLLVHCLRLVCSKWTYTLMGVGRK
ncbi:Protein BONZAI 2 [Camellia lanceoleosa]|uniref:Protein BONZAI 2 n=1 Tax=Camellia lanceoleosa TaxID=1840588 RepID=A0ACC0II18_9ERIC|nr:Protein BONZAI 2 [Camellia lanceoleosa]